MNADAITFALAEAGPLYKGERDHPHVYSWTCEPPASKFEDNVSERRRLLENQGTRARVYSRPSAVKCQESTDSNFHTRRLGIQKLRC